MSVCHEGEASLLHWAGKLGFGKVDCSGGLIGIPHSRDVGSLTVVFSIAHGSGEPGRTT